MDREGIPDLWTLVKERFPGNIEHLFARIVIEVNEEFFVFVRTIMYCH